MKVSQAIPKVSWRERYLALTRGPLTLSGRTGADAQEGNQEPGWKQGTSLAEGTEEEPRGKGGEHNRKLVL